MSAAERAAAARSIGAHLLGAPWATSGSTVAAYVPVGSEPGSLDMLDGLLGRGIAVLLPVVAPGQPLDWAAYDGKLIAGPGWLREPGGERLGPAALGTADVVLVPALAVDRLGTRLGRGAGHYDRSLPFARPGVPLLAILYDDELLAEPLPAEPHDVPMTGAISPAAGLVQLPVSPMTG